MCDVKKTQRGKNFTEREKEGETSSSTSSFPSNTPQHIRHAESSSTSSLCNSKQTSSTTGNKKIYEGLAVLNDKRLKKTEKTSTLEDEMHKIKLLKAKSELETCQLEHNLTVKRFKYESEKMESEVRQNKIKEDILLLELRHKKKMWGIE